MSCPEKKTDRSFRLAAAVATIAIHCVLFTSLLGCPTLRAPNAKMTTEDVALQVVWIPKEVPNPPSVKAPVQAAPAVPRTFTPKRRRNDALANAENAPSGLSDAPAPPGSESNQHSLNLTLPPTRIEFNDDVMIKGRAKGTAPTNRMNLQFIDRSFSGTMQRMTKARTCGDLRAALQKHPESTMTILRTMDRLDC